MLNLLTVRSSFRATDTILRPPDTDDGSYEALNREAMLTTNLDGLLGLDEAWTVSAGTTGWWANQRPTRAFSRGTIWPSDGIPTEGTEVRTVLSVRIER
jgi:hypothetical protein